MSATILGTTDVALRLGISAERVRQLEAQGKLHAQRTVRGVRLFDGEEVERFAQEREQQKAAMAGASYEEGN
jgi:DNA-binding transcriptional MerR regulator